MTVDVTFSQADFGEHSHVFDCGISTMSDPGIHDPTAIVAVIFVGQVCPMASQSRAAKCARKRWCLACRVFQSRCLRL